MVVDITQTPTEIFKIIDDFADTLGFLPSISQLHIQKSPLFNKRAETIANLARDKIVQLYDSPFPLPIKIQDQSILPLLELAKIYNSLAEKEQTKAIADLAQKQIKGLQYSYARRAIEYQTQNVFSFLELAKVYESLGDVHKYKALKEEGMSNLKNCREQLRVLMQKLDREMPKFLNAGLDEYGKLEVSFFGKTLNATSDLFEIIELHLSLKEIDEAQGFLQQLEDLTHKMPNVFNKACQTLIKIASVHLKMGNTIKAEELLQKATKTADISYEWVAESFKDIAVLYLEMGKTEKPKELLEKSIERRQSLPLSPKVQLLTKVSLAYAELGEIDKAISLLKEAESYLNDFVLMQTHVPSIASVYIKIKNLKEAQRLISLLMPDWRNDEIIFSLVDAYYEANDVASARRAVDKIFSPQLKKKAFIKIELGIVYL